MKILVISDAWQPQVNGVVRTYEHLRDMLEKRGHEFKIVGPSDFPFTIPTPGYSEIKLALAPSGRIRRIYEDYKPDRVHVATEGPLGWAARNFLYKCGIPFTTSYHTQFPDYLAKRVGKPFPFLHDWVQRTATRTLKKFHSPAYSIFVATRSLEEDLVSKGFSVPMKRLTRGVNIDIFHPGKSPLEGQFKKPVAIYVGRVAIEKNLKAFLGMEWSGSKVIVGEGPSKKYLQRLYPEAHFVGKKIGDDLADHYRASDVFVFPSRTDTFGIVLIEALACGVPVAAYPVMGPQDIVVQPFLGSIDDDLEKAAQEAMKNGTSEQRFAHVKEHYTWEKAADQFISAVEAIEEENIVQS